MNSRPEVPSGPLLLVASTGGHLAQLVRHEHRWGVNQDSVYFTFRSAQSLSLLEGRKVQFVPYVRPRDWRGAIRAGYLAKGCLSQQQFVGTVSTGAAIASMVLPIARLYGVPAIYMESVSRTDGPSLTGKLLEASRIVDMRSPHSWASKRGWSSCPSVWEAFAVESRSALADLQGAKLRFFVTLGTIEGYPFTRLIRAVQSLGLASDESVWQLGDSPSARLPGRVVNTMSADEFIREARAADVVVTHAGVGSLMALFEAGICPVVVPRESSHGEHVDDHQLQIAQVVADAGLAAVSRADGLDYMAIEYSRSRRIVATIA